MRGDVKKTTHPYGGYVLVNTRGLLDFLKAPLVPHERSVFLWMMARMPMGNEGFIQVDDVARELDLAPSTVVKSLSRLVTLGFVTRRKESGDTLHGVHPFYAWKGTLPDLARRL